MTSTAMSASIIRHIQHTSTGYYHLSLPLSVSSLLHSSPIAVNDDCIFGIELIKETIAMLEKCATIKFRQIHQQIADQRTPETGASFKARKQVRDWFNIPNSFLWVRGGREYPTTFSALTPG